jgi:hypothetical protein
MLRHRGCVRRGGRARSLAGWVPLPALWRQRPLRAGQWFRATVAVQRLSPPGLADRGHAVREHQAAADEVVPGDLPDQPGQDRPVGAGTQAPDRRELPDCLADAPQDHDRDEPTRGRAPPVGRGPSLDAYLGGEHAGGKPGRGSENKVPFVAAVSLNWLGNPVYAKLTPVPGFTSSAISTWAQSNLAPGTHVLSDGLGCFAAVIDAGCTHRVEVVGQRKPRELPQFKWVNTVLGNLKTMLSGAYKAFKYAKYAQSYLGAFAYRFNRRFDLAELVVRLVVDVCRGKATPLREIRHADFRF